MIQPVVRVLLLIIFAALLASPASAVTSGGQLTLTETVRVFFDDWIGPIATMLAVAGLVFGIIQIGLARGPEAYGNAIRWLVVVAVITAILVILSSGGINAATV